MTRNHRDLIVWQKSVDLAVEINRLTEKLQRQQKYALVDQLSRAALSVPSNIAEGRARSSAKDFVRFLYIARGSLEELDAQLYVSVKSGYLTDADIELAMRLYTEVEKMLNAMISKMTKNT
ncbi:MAG: four helix bundle protein [Selenomonadaceae bacterium]|nr:four helix bundle protein [Selenomonadaceae bacterium]